MKEAKNIGISVGKPSGSCEDRNCPFHGTLKLRGRNFIGNVVRAKAAKTATVAWETRFFVPKYERYARRLTKIHVHNPLCINATEGDIVKIAECRPLAKTKNFVIVEKLGRKEKIVTEEEDIRGKGKKKPKEEKKESKKEAKKEREE